jgi:Rha family phage regulatory protein
MTSQTYNSVLSAVQGALQDPPIDASRQPVVFIRGGEIFASSRDVALGFDKGHRHVLEAIDNLIKQEPDLGLRNFRQTPYVEPQNGQTYRSFDMDRDGFTLLAMGFTGTKALKWKLKYIAAFNAMEAELRRRSSGPMVPQTLSEALRLAADQAEEIERQANEIKAFAPKVAAHARLAEAFGSMCITDAAKTLQINPQVLFRWLRANSWIYKRIGSTEDVAYQDKIKAGYLEHKATPVPRPDGTEKVVTRVRVTPKGLAKLAEIFNASVPQGEVH